MIIIIGTVFSPQCFTHVNYETPLKRTWCHRTWCTCQKLPYLWMINNSTQIPAFLCLWSLHVCCRQYWSLNTAYKCIITHLPFCYFCPLQYFPLWYIWPVLNIYIVCFSPHIKYIFYISHILWLLEWSENTGRKSSKLVLTGIRKVLWWVSELYIERLDFRSFVSSYTQHRNLFILINYYSHSMLLCQPLAALLKLTADTLTVTGSLFSE